MTFSRNRSANHSLAAIPRLGFLLFLLALAIVVWPNLRSSPTQLNSSSTHFESDQDKPDLNVSSSVQAIAAQASSEDSTLSESSQITNAGDNAGDKAGDVAVDKAGESVAIIDGQTRDLLSLVVDSSLRMSKREMPAYWELVRRSANAGFANLRQSANLKILFNDLYSKPSKHRGDLLGLDITIRRVIRYEAEAGNAAGAKCVYEVWGSTDQSQTWLYAFITDSLPEGFTEETLVRKRASFAGYFFKLMAYQPGSAAPNAKPLLAPLLIGKFSIKSPTTTETKSENSLWPSIGLALLTMVIVTYFSVRVFWSSQSREKVGAKQKIKLEDL